MTTTSDRLNEKEEWRPVSGFEGIYDVSSYGRVRRLRFRNRDIKYDVPTIKATKTSTKSDYRQVVLYRDGYHIDKLVHRMVLEAFVGQCPSHCEASHVNGLTGDNHVSNLVWETRAENNARKKAHGTWQGGEKCNFSKLTGSQVKEIVSKLGTKWQYEIAKEYGVTPETISYIKTGKTWKHITDPVSFFPEPLTPAHDVAPCEAEDQP